MEARRLLLSALASITALAPACGGDDESVGRQLAQTAAEQLCGAMSEYATKCAPTACDQALVTDCSDVAGMLSDPYLEAATTCIDSGKAPAACLAEARSALKPTEAQRAFATQFCDKCALGLSQCEDAFFAGGNSDAQRAGALLLPLGDGLVEELRTSCADGFGCAAKFPSCAEEVLAKRALPTETLKCLLDSIRGEIPLGSGDPACGGTSSEGTSASSGGGGAPTSGSTSSSTSGSGGGGGTKSICFDQTLTVDALDLTKGDAEFNGHGPDVDIDITVSRTATSVKAHACVKMTETQADWTTGSRCKDLTASGENAGLVTNAKHHVSYTDHDHDPDDAIAEASSKTFDPAFVTKIQCLGDHVGDDICAGSACSKCAITLGCVEVLVP